VYPEANVTVVEGGLMLLPSRPHLARRPKARWDDGSLHERRPLQLSRAKPFTPPPKVKNLR